MKENNEKDDVDGDPTRCTLARGNSYPFQALHCLVPGGSGAPVHRMFLRSPSTPGTPIVLVQRLQCLMQSFNLQTYEDGNSLRMSQTARNLPNIPQAHIPAPPIAQEALFWETVLSREVIL